MKTNFNKLKSSALTLISSVSFVLLLWFLLFGKIKASEAISSLFKKLPQNQSELVKTTEKILGDAVQKVRGENAKDMIKKGSEVFEESAVAEPAREMRENIKQKVDETFESAKRLPAQELNTLKRQICKEWFGDEFLATPSGR